MAWVFRAHCLLNKMLYLHCVWVYEECSLLMHDCNQSSCGDLSTSINVCFSFRFAFFHRINRNPGTKQASENVTAKWSENTAVKRRWRQNKWHCITFQQHKSIENHSHDAAQLEEKWPIKVCDDGSVHFLCILPGWHLPRENHARVLRWSSE